MKLVSKPISFSDETDQSRDIAGVNKWARSSRTISFIMLILGWFTIPVEVFFRRDFGQRWFTTINFYAGLVLLLLFSVFQYLINLIWGWIQDFVISIESALNPFYTKPAPSLVDTVIDHSMMFFLSAYALLGSYHLFKIWWRNRTNTALHSFDDGTSRLEPIAELFIEPINRLASPVINVLSSMISGQQYQRTPHQMLIKDKSAFTDTVIEPLALVLLGWWLHGIVSVWLWVSAVSVIIHANWKETARLNKILDFQDSIIEANVMMQLKHEVEQSNAPAPFMQQAAEAIRANPQMAPQMAGQYPDLMSIIDVMNRDRSHLAN